MSALFCDSDSSVKLEEQIPMSTQLATTGNPINPNSKEEYREVTY